MTIFIAGGTSGIGYSLAKHYCSKGFRVGICGRNIVRVPKNNYTNLEIYEADVSLMFSLDMAVKKFLVKDEDGNNIAEISDIVPYVIDFA